MNYISYINIFILPLMTCIKFPFMFPSHTCQKAVLTGETAMTCAPTARRIPLNLIAPEISLASIPKFHHTDFTAGEPVSLFVVVCLCVINPCLYLCASAICEQMLYVSLVRHVGWWFVSVLLPFFIVLLDLFKFFTFIAICNDHTGYNYVH